MSSEQYALAYDGGALGRQSVNKMGAAAAHADDYALQELLRLSPPTGAGYAKAILPMREMTFVTGVQNQALVSPTSFPSVPLVVMPFRAVVGSRIVPNVAPPSPVDPIIPTAAEQSYRDIRSAVFAVASDGSNLGYQIPAALFPSNTTIEPRWDAIFAALYVDQPSSTVQIMVKPPAGGTAGPVGGVPTVITSVGSPPMAVSGPSPGILVVTGTPASIPLFPGIADVPPAGGTSACVIYILLAYVLIPAGWTSGANLITTAHLQIAAPVGQIDEALGVPRTGPMPSGWPHTNTSRPTYGMPPTMVGGAKKHMLLDATGAAGLAPVGNAAVLDASMDWRRRYFQVKCQALPSAAALFASDPAATTAPFVPSAWNAAPPLPAALELASVAIQPFIVLCPNVDSFATAAIQADKFTDVVGGWEYVLPLTNLQNGWTLDEISLFFTGSSNGTAALQLIKTNLATGAQTSLGLVTGIAGGPARTEVTLGGFDEVIDTTTYSYAAIITSSSGGGETALTWSGVGASVFAPMKTEFAGEGQSMRDDSVYYTGSFVGAQGASFAFYAAPGLIPQMGANSALGIYVDLATGNLCLYYLGTPGVKCAFFVEATGALDNL